MELFYEIADTASAEARKLVLASGRSAEVKFRNLHYPEVRADFGARGGTRPPALWDGETLHHGLDAIRARLLP